MLVQAECRKTGLFIPFSSFANNTIPHVGRLLLNLELVADKALQHTASSGDISFNDLRCEAYDERYAKKEQRKLLSKTTAKELKEIDDTFGLVGITTIDDVLECLA